MPKRFKRGKKRVRFSVGAEESDGVVQEESEVMEVVEQEEEGDDTAIASNPASNWRGRPDEALSEVCFV